MSLKILIQRPILASVISIIIMLCGLVATFNLPLSQFPNITPPTIIVNAMYPGANAATGAKVVAAQIENQLNWVSNLMYMNTSTTATGQISITLTYEVGTNLNYSINEVLNRLYAAMPLLPQVVQKMGVTARKASTDMLLIVAFYSDPYLDLLYVSDYLQRTLENDLLLLPSVGQVNIMGPGNYAMRLWLNPNLMQRYNVTVDDLQNVINDQNEQYIVGRTNAPPEDSFNSKTIAMLGQQMYSRPDQFENMIIRNESNQTIRIKDVARVQLGSSNYSTIAQINFRDSKNKFHHYPSVMMQVMLTPGANQLEAKAAILKTIEESAKHFPYGLHYRITIDNSRFVQASINNVVDTMLIAVLLVGIVIFIFLQNLRGSLIAVFTIPVSIIGTMACLYMFGYSLNTLSLFAMILAIGIVVDDAIVIVENIDRLMHKHPDYSIGKVISMTLDEVLGAIIAIVMVLSVVFIPVMTLNGLAGIMYRQFAVTIACSVVLSGISALTFAPAISHLILKPGINQRIKYLQFIDFGFTWLLNRYLAGAKFLICRKKLTWIIWLTVVLSMIIMFRLVPKGFVPQEDQGLVFATMNLPAASSLSNTRVKVDELIEKLTTNPAIDSVVSVSGLDFLDSTSQKTYAATFFISLKDWGERKDKKALADYIIKQINQLGSKEAGVIIRAFNQPPIRGLSVTGGVEFYIEDPVVGDPKSLEKVVNKFILHLKNIKKY